MCSNEYIPNWIYYCNKRLQNDFLYDSKLWLTHSKTASKYFAFDMRIFLYQTLEKISWSSVNREQGMIFPDSIGFSNIGWYENIFSLLQTTKAWPFYTIGENDYFKFYLHICIADTVLQVLYAEQQFILKERSIACFQDGKLTRNMERVLRSLSHTCSLKMKIFVQQSRKHNSWYKWFQFLVQQYIQYWYECVYCA